jgi:hypothetical protein
MKNKFFFLLIFLTLAIIVGCRDSGTSPIEDAGIQGQVYSISTPGPTPIGWTPPPLEIISTIVVLDTNKKLVKEFATDEKGRFKIFLPPGTYYLRVKESMIPAETGPYEVKRGEILLAEAHYDNGMR